MTRYITIDAPPTALDSNSLPYQRVEAPITAFGANQANSLGQFSDALGRNVANFRDQLRQQQLLAHECAANDAMNKHRSDAIEALRDYKSHRTQAAVERFPEFKQALIASHAAALQGLSPQARTLVKPHLDQALNHGLQIGLDHLIQQDHAWSDESSLQSLALDQQEALLHRDDPARVRALAERGLGEWLKIGERKGWSDQQIGQRAQQSLEQLYGAVLDGHLQNGELPKAQTMLLDIKDIITPEKFDQMQRKFQDAERQMPDLSDPATFNRYVRPVNMPDGEQTPGQADFSRNTIDRATMDRIMRGEQTQQPYQEINPQLNQEWGDSRNYQLRNPGEQQFAQIPSPPGTATDVPTDSAVSGLDTNGFRGSAPPTDPAVSGADPNRADAPILHRSSDRQKSILKGMPSKIILAENSKANGERPWYEQHNYGKDPVDRYDDIIRAEAEREGVDPDLVRAIMYMEGSHGYYFGLSPIAEKSGMAKSLMPMNIRPEFWGSLAPDHPDLKDVKSNIHAGVLLLRRITERLDDPTVAKIATLYNSMSADGVNDYGRRVETIMKEKPWRKPMEQEGVQVFPGGM